MARFSDILNNFFKPLNMAQRVLFGFMSVVILAGVTSVFLRATQPDYTLLIGNLEPSSANNIV